jgi:hypothetical protein
MHCPLVEPILHVFLWRLTVGMLVSLFVGDVVINLIVDHYLWGQIRKDYPNTPIKKNAFSRGVGYVERTLYTLALCASVPQWIAVWLGVKVVVKWQRNSGQPTLDKPADVSGPDSSSGPVDNVWLIGSGLSVLFGLLGAWIALGHLPCFPDLH